MNTTNKNTAFIHFGGPFTDEQPAPRMTTAAEDVRQKFLPWQTRGLMYTATGYGSKIPTSWQIKYEGRWRRVYCRIYSNSGTLFICSKGKPLATVDIY